MSAQPSLRNLGDEVHRLGLSLDALVMRETPNGYRLYDGDVVVGDLTRNITPRRSWTWALAAAPRRWWGKVEARSTAITHLLRAHAGRAGGVRDDGQRAADSMSFTARKALGAADLDARGVP